MLTCGSAHIDEGGEFDGSQEGEQAKGDPVQRWQEGLGEAQGPGTEEVVLEEDHEAQGPGTEEVSRPNRGGILNLTKWSSNFSNSTRPTENSVVSPLAWFTALIINSQRFPRVAFPDVTM